MDTIVFELNRNRLTSIIVDSWRIDYQYAQSAESYEEIPTRIDICVTSSPDFPLQPIPSAYTKVLERDLVGFKQFVSN